MKFLRLAHPGKCTVTGLAIAVLMIAILISSLFILKAGKWLLTDLRFNI